MSQRASQAELPPSSTMGAPMTPLSPPALNAVLSSSSPRGTKRSNDSYKFKDREVDAKNNATILFQLITSKKYRDAIERLDSNADEAATWHITRDPKNANQYLDRKLPIHIACELLRRDRQKVLERLLAASPVGCKRGAADVVGDEKKKPHLRDLVRRLVTVYPEGCKRVDHKGRLPIHIATKKHAPLPVIAVLLRPYPKSLIMVDANKKTPADYIGKDIGKNAFIEATMNAHKHRLTGSRSTLRPFDIAKHMSKVQDSLRKHNHYLVEARRKIYRKSYPKHVVKTNAGIKDSEMQSKRNMIARSIISVESVDTASTGYKNQRTKQNINKMFDAIKKMKQDPDAAASNDDEGTTEVEKQLKETQHELLKANIKIAALRSMNEKLRKLTRPTIDDNNDRNSMVLQLPSDISRMTYDTSSSALPSHRYADEPENTHPPAAGLSSEEDFTYIIALEKQVEALNRVIGSHAQLLMDIQEEKVSATREWRYGKFESYNADVIAELKAWFRGEIVSGMPIQMFVTALLFEDMNVFDAEEYWSDY